MPAVDPRFRGNAGCRLVGGGHHAGAVMVVVYFLPGIAPGRTFLYLWVVQSVRTTSTGPVVRNKKQEKASITQRLRRADFLLFLSALSLGGIGVLAIYAAEADYRQLYAVNQATGLTVGFVGAVVLALLDYRWLGQHLRLVYGVTIAMLVAVLIAGLTVNGSQSWLSIGPVDVQPSEFAKPLTIVVLAGYVADNSFAYDMTFVKAMGILAVPVLLVLAQPDLGTAMVFAAIFVAVVFVGGARWRQLGALFALGCVAVYLVVKFEVLEPYQLARLTSFIDPKSDPQVSYQ